MSYRLGADGYAFSKIDPVPTPDNDKKTVSLTFFIEPGNRVYVRHINFNNTTAINDETLRREMRQLEGGWLSNSAIERSKERLQRLPYVEKVEFETKPVPGSADLVDVDYNIKEGLPGQFGGGIGYSEAQKFSLNGNFVHSNFMGTGDRIALEVNAGKYSKSYTFAHTDPYTTIDGVARTTSLTYRDITQFVAAASKFSTKQLTGAMSWSYPITEYQYLQVGVSANKNELVVSQGYSSQQAIDWVQHNGNTFTRDLDDTNGDGIVNSLDNPYTVYGTNFYTYEADRRLESRHAQPGAVRRPRTAPHRLGPLCPAVQRRALLRHQLSSSCSTSRSGASGCCPTMRASITPTALGKTTFLPPVSELLCRRPGQRARLIARARSDPGTTSASATPSAATSGSSAAWSCCFPVPDKWKSAARVSWFYDMGNVF